MIKDLKLVTRAALLRYRNNRRPFLFEGRLGDTHMLTIETNSAGDYAATNRATRRTHRFASLGELLAFLAGPA